MLSQANILPTTPMGANLIGGGATIRAWAPRATAVYVNGTFGGTPMTGQPNALLMAKDVNGCWTGFIPNAGDGNPYHFLGRRGVARERLQA
jgi:1,4-alpha-glucan branching enzyme